MEKLENVIREFNRYHGSEAQAKIVKIEGDAVIVEFSGTFCKTCGLYDYFDDLKWEAMNFGLNLEFLEVLEGKEDFEKGRYLVKYKLKR